MMNKSPMKIGMVGLGRMGANMVRRLLRAGHQCRVYDVSEQAVQRLVGEGAEGAGSLSDLVAGLARPRTVWLMLPAQLTGATVTELLDLLQSGDAIVDGGNSSYRDDIDRAQVAASRGIDYVDCGTSGGVWGLERGYCLMIGGPDRAVGPWLLDLTAEALLADPRLDQFAGRIADSGEGRWTSIAAIEEGVPAPLLTAALYSRFASRGSALFADKVQSAQRLEFGGHLERREPS